VFSLPQAGSALGLRKTTLRREAREGRLRVSKRGGRYFTTGAWLREWLESGEVVRTPKLAARNGTAAREAGGGSG
jgi:hypothetical protein